jgi:FixJ family two-component response regulator
MMGAPIYTQEHRDQVLALTAQGLTNAQIAAKTGIKLRSISRLRSPGWEPPRGASMPLVGRAPMSGASDLWGPS